MVHKSTAYSLKQSKSLRYRKKNITAKKKPETQATDQQRRNGHPF